MIDFFYYENLQQFKQHFKETYKAHFQIHTLMLKLLVDYVYRLQVFSQVPVLRFCIPPLSETLCFSSCLI